MFFQFSSEVNILKHTNTPKQWKVKECAFQSWQAVWLIIFREIIANGCCVLCAVWLAGCVSHACWTQDVVSVTVRMARHSSPPPVCQSIRPPLSRQRGAGESQDTALECLGWSSGGTRLWIGTYSVLIEVQCQECLPKAHENVSPPDAQTPARWKTRTTGPTTTVPHPILGWFYWV